MKPERARPTNVPLPAGVKYPRAFENQKKSLGDVSSATLAKLKAVDSQYSIATMNGKIPHMPI